MNQSPLREEPEGQFSPRLEEAVCAFIAYRKDTKHPMTPYAEKLFRRRLVKYKRALHTEQELIEHIDNAIISGWRNIFPKDLPDHERRRRWIEHPEEYYDAFTEEERNRMDNLLF